MPGNCINPKPRWLKPSGVFFALLMGLCPLVGSSHEIQKIDPKKLGFVPPAPGTYELARIMPAPNGVVLDTGGKKRKLIHYTTGKITLLGFIYTTCHDVGGCPLTYQVFYDLRVYIEGMPELHDKVRFVSLSFDPDNDTPETMLAYGGAQVVASKGVQWYFLTPPSRKDLYPLLEGFGQDVSVRTDRPKDAPRELTHVLKVFLIDKTGWVREIYTTSYLIPQIVLNDILTLALEEKPAALKAPKRR